MNGIISLVHFCETHGPTVMFCTQGVHRDQPSWSLINFSKPSPNKNTGSSSETNLPDSSVLEQGGINNYLGGLSFSSNLYCSSLCNPLPSSFPNPEPMHNYHTNTRTSDISLDSSPNFTQKTYPKTDSDNSSNIDNRQRNFGKTNFSQCPTCSPRFPSTSKNSENHSSDGGLGYVSQDPLNPDTIFTTTRYPSHPRLYAALRQACVRSLSCEFCPGREGPVLFGDEKHGYTLSYMFKVRDDRARGSQRFYALALLMTDRLYLIASATFIIGKFRSLARFLQAKALSNRNEAEKKGRAQSMQLRPSPPTRSPIADNSRLAHPLLPTGRSLTGDIQSNFSTGMPKMLTSDQFLRRRSSTNSKQLRSLEELFELPHLMAVLHASFSLILSCGSRRLLESPPMPLQKWAEPTTVLMDVLPLSRNQQERYDSQNSSPSSLGSTCLTPRFRLDHLGQLYHILGRSQFGKLVFNLVIGNQVVIRSTSQSIISDVMVVLQDILPHLCFRKLEYETTYQPIWMCNLLGLERDSVIPDEVDLTSLVLLEIDAPGYGSRSHDNLNSISNTLMALSFGVPEPINVQQSFPHFVNEVVEIVQQCDYSVPGLSPMDPSHTSTYNMMSSKPPLQVFGFNVTNNLAHPHLSPKQVRLKLIALKEAWSCKGRMLANFLRLSHMPPGSAALPGDPQSLLPRLLQLLSVTTEDLPVVRFFATAFRPRPVSIH